MAAKPQINVKSVCFFARAEVRYGKTTAFMHLSHPDKMDVIDIATDLLAGGEVEEFAWDLKGNKPVCYFVSADQALILASRIQPVIGMVNIAVYEKKIEEVIEMREAVRRVFVLTSGETA